MGLTIAATAESLNLHSRVYDRTIAQTVKQGLVTESYMTPVYADKLYVAPNAEIDDIVQPYQSAFTPNLNVNIDSVETRVDPLKADIQFTRDELDQFYDSWMIEWVEDGKPLTDWSFPKYILEMHVIPKIRENIEKKLVWKGEFVAPTSGTAGDAGDGTDGLAIKIVNAISDSLLVPIATGAFTPTTMVDKIETFCLGLPETYRDLAGNVFMSTTNARKYYYDYRERFGYAAGNLTNENNQLAIDATNKRIVGLPSMEGSNRIFFTPKTNMICARRPGQPDVPVIRWQEFERTLKGLGEFSRGYGFKYWSEVFVNDQA